MNSFKLEKNVSKEEYNKRGAISFIVSVVCYVLAYLIEGTAGDAIGTLGLLTLLIAIFSWVVALFKKPSKK